MRRAITVILILAALAGASWFGYEQFGRARAAKAPDYDLVKVSRGNIVSTVSATGSVLPERTASLAFQGSGTIVNVYVKQGDAVTAGQVLAELDRRDLDLAVRQAEVGVQTAEAQLRQLQDPPSQVDIAAAQAQLASAQTAYQQLLNGSDQDEQASARAQVEQAKVALDQAQQAYDKVKDRPEVGLLPQAAQLQQATINYETAQAQYRVNTRGAKQGQLASSQAQIAQAQAQLDKLQRGPSQAQLDIARASVDNARLGLEQAQRRIENTRLVAPWNGVVTAVNAVAGTLPQPAQPAVELADASLYHINVKVDEADVASIAEGQPVSIELDAFASQRLNGHVATIAPAASDQATAGVVTYQVRIDFEPTDLQLRTGMSATATITSSSHENVLLVPNRALQVDRETGKTYVERLVGDTPQRVEVLLSLRGDQQSEVREGLADGDQIVIRNVSSLNRLQQSMSQ